MKITDIVALAKQGYSVADVKELLSLAENTPDTPGEDTEVQKTEPKESPKDTEDPEIAEAINYKELYTSATKEIESLKAQLDTAQKHNTTSNIAPLNVATDEETINDLVRAFM